MKKKTRVGFKAWGVLCLISSMWAFLFVPQISASVACAAWTVAATISFAADCIIGEIEKSRKQADDLAQASANYLAGVIRGDTRPMM